MKRGVLMLAVLSMAFTACKENPSKKVKAENVEIAAQKDEAAKSLPVMTFDKLEHDFGTINEGDKVETEFTFTNTGKGPLTILSAKPSCGCTVPSWPENKVIQPGESDKIVVAFDSKNKPNQQQKTVTVTSNAEQRTQTLRFKAFVAPDPELQKQRDERAAQRKAQQEAAAQSNTNTN